MKDIHKMSHTLRLLSIVILCSCRSNGAQSPSDIFLDTPQKTHWVQTKDNTIKIPLSPYYAWEHQSTNGTDDVSNVLLSMHAHQGPTYLRVLEIKSAQASFQSVKECVVAHQEQLVHSLNQSKILATTPSIREETYEKKKVWRLHYSVPLHAKHEKKDNLLTASWFHLLLHNRCIGVGLTSVLQASTTDSLKPDVEQVRRFEQTFQQLVLETKFLL